MLLNQIKSNQFVRNLLFLLICLSGIISLQINQIKTNQTQTTNYLQEEQNRQTLLAFQKFFPSLGFDNLKADSIFLHFVQYFGDDPARDETGYSLVPDYFETIVQYDPHFTQAYLTLSTANTMYAGKPQQTITLIQQVLDSISSTTSPDNFSLWNAKGLDELLFIGDNEAAKNSYQMAAKLANLQNSASGKNLADRYLQTANFLATNPDTTEAQIVAWKTILPNLRDQQTRQEVIAKIQDLETKIKSQQTTVLEDRK
ncbi:hypothetical protein Sta7437_1337 [Stanieria cyanosphaera PCC 7437]|uniref:Uncharacterized protein n=1 Tax=Stanieria cyanosphaera (strain ATCC 29371 / PCC 7437) TaxID=111780 RepID=K9XS46_STAC7|nr:hypothetical protein [Stanieria cyanosphaera]AFZ34904.1 hypothetical protein Sta7437_1337 [Stanieria cyanosphaera PCC 7437]